ncbi:asparaginyl-tRNA synthetase [Desulfacinum infernum DSM 9756]|uniref:Asparagine--tRNA ligase n=1 Tax=Desulfacinum infernum DSM 9756 TaxID=1121391 RepID=A0A1M5EWR0_9BACT|nr:asparagine--tRNA ligase [Desulfacinum infernum]SHF83675.1 asparaginyl-tRNA synthetase [Desulfacinum infernum DSM 9756]
MEKAVRIAQLFQNEEAHKEKEVTIQGWVRTRRDSKAGISFIEVNDGSCLRNLQVIAERTDPELTRVVDRLATGCSVQVRGVVKPSPGKGQSIEVHAREIVLFGWADPAIYPLQKKRHSFEFLRTIAHLRPRTNTLGAVARLRNRLSFAVHQFFQKEGFVYVHTPIITSSDCEGAGEVFRVTTLDPANPPSPQGRDGNLYSLDFFEKPAFLTVSGQLQAEIYALALGKVYTFGPTFRAENSNTSRHLAEFWMIEPEMAFYDLQDNLELAQSFIKYVISAVLEDCAEDLQLFARFVEPTLMETLETLVRETFEVITYTEAVELLKKSGESFDYPVEWGSDLQSEHERYLTEKKFRKPVAIIHFPRAIKPFYMRVNEDEKTVAAMDVLVPRVGEIIGGSQREERLDVLLQQMELKGIPVEEYQWYVDLRRFGSAPHSGFGLGLERLVQFATGLGNIREVIPFPRTPGHAEF